MSDQRRRCWADVVQMLCVIYDMPTPSHSAEYKSAYRSVCIVIDTKKTTEYLLGTKTVTTSIWYRSK